MLQCNGMLLGSVIGAAETRAMAAAKERTRDVRGFQLKERSKVQSAASQSKGSKQPNQKEGLHRPEWTTVETGERGMAKSRDGGRTKAGEESR